MNLTELEKISSVNRQDLGPDVFERAIIGSLLECDAKAAAKIARECDPEVFATPCNLYAYTILRNAAFAKTPLGRGTAAAAIQQAPGSLQHFTYNEDVSEFLKLCVEACQPFGSWPEYVKQVHLAHTRRKLLAAFDEATISALSAHSAEDAMGDAIFKVIEAAGELRRNSVRDNYEMSSIVEGYLEEYNTGQPLVSTYPQEKLNFIGGARKGQVIVIAAPTKSGKSWWVLDMVLHAANRFKRSSRIYSLEMSQNDILDRAISMENGLDLIDVVMRKIPKDDMEDHTADMAELPISIVDTRISPGRILADLAAMGDSRPDIVVVDHLDLFNFKDGNEVNALKGALANFKDAAKMYGVTFLLVSQFRRPRNDEEDKRPTIGMLKGGSAIEQISDMVIFINKEFTRNHFGDQEEYFMSVPIVRQGKAPKKFKVDFGKDYRFR